MILFWCVPMPHKLLREYFSYSKKERTGITVLLVLILLLTILPFLLPFFIHHPKQDDSAFRQAIASLQSSQADSGNRFPATDREGYPERPYAQYNRPAGKNAGAVSYRLFNFDPNTLSAGGWQELGIREKTIGTIQHYLASGGRFKEPDDIRKIWGLHADEVERLLPYVKIETEDQPAKIPSGNSYPAYPKKEKPLSPFDINTADTAAFIALPGIGSKLAARIVSFRDKLGGFYAAAQVAETFGLADSVFNRIRPYLLVIEPRLRSIHINKAGLEELKSHPYIRYNLAQAIIQYRNQHGTFKEVGDIKKIMMVDEELYKRLVPYLSAD